MSQESLEIPAAVQRALAAIDAQDNDAFVAAFAPDGSLVALLTEEDGQARSLAVFVG